MKIQSHDKYKTRLFSTFFTSCRKKLLEANICVCTGIPFSRIVHMFWGKYLIENSIRIYWQSQIFEKRLLASLCVSFRLAVRRSFRIAKFDCCWTDFLEFLIAELYQNPSSKFKFGYSRTKTHYTYRPTQNCGYFGYEICHGCRRLWPKWSEWYEHLRRVLNAIIRMPLAVTLFIHFLFCCALRTKQENGTDTET